MKNLIARCVNQTTREVRGARIYEDDIDAVEIELARMTPKEIRESDEEYRNMMSR